MDIKKTFKYMVLSTLSFTFMNSFVKYLSHLPAYELVFFRSLGTLILTMSFLSYHKIPILGNKRKLMLFRSIAGVTSMTLYFLSLKYLTLGTAVSLRYIAPIFAAIFAVFLLKEKVKPIQWMFFLVAFGGVLILRGFDGATDKFGLFLVILSAFFSGFVYVALNKIGKSDHPVVVVNFFMLVATIVGGILSIFTWESPQGIEWLLLSCMGVSGYFGQLYMTKAFQSASTSQAAPLKYIEVIFAVTVGLVWFKEVYTIWSLLGIIMIIVGLSLNALYKGKNKT